MGGPARVTPPTPTPTPNPNTASCCTLASSHSSWKDLVVFFLLHLKTVMVNISPICQLFYLFILINNANIEQVLSAKYLGISVDAALSRSARIDYVCGKIRRRIFFCLGDLLRSFGTRKSCCFCFFNPSYLVLRSMGLVFGTVVSGESDKYLLQDCSQSLKLHILKEDLPAPALPPFSQG